jgi:hypothetical protein
MAGCSGVSGDEKRPTGKCQQLGRQEHKIYNFYLFSDMFFFSLWCFRPQRRSTTRSCRPREMPTTGTTGTGSGSALRSETSERKEKHIWEEVEHHQTSYKMYILGLRLQYIKSTISTSSQICFSFLSDVSDRNADPRVVDRRCGLKHQREKKNISEKR